MRTSIWCGLVVMLTSWAAAQSAPSMVGPVPSTPVPAVRGTLEGKVKAEWEAFKNKDQKTYAGLLAEDFAGIEDDGEGMRGKRAAVGEIDRSVVSKYYLFALKVLPLAGDSALVTYELTMEFPPKAQLRFKRVLVSELWLKRDGQWKLRHYQETRVR